MSSESKAFASASDVAQLASSVHQLQAAFASAQGLGLGLGLGAVGKAAPPPAAVAVAGAGSAGSGGSGNGGGATDPLAQALDAEPPKVKEIEYKIRAKAAKELDPLKLGSGVSTAVRLAVPATLAAQYVQDVAKDAPARYADIRLALVKAATEYALRARIDKVCAAAYEQSAKAAKREAQAFAEKVRKLDAAYDRYVKGVPKAPGNALRTDFFADFALPAYAHVAVEVGEAATVEALQWVAAHTGGGGGGSTPVPSGPAITLQTKLLGDALANMKAADPSGLAQLLLSLGFVPAPPPAGGGSGSGSGTSAGGVDAATGSSGTDAKQPAGTGGGSSAAGKSAGSDADG